MSIRNYATYYQGALFTEADFDPAKTVLYALQKVLGMEISEACRERILSGVLDEEMIEFLNSNLLDEGVDEDVPYSCDYYLGKCLDTFDAFKEEIRTLTEGFEGVYARYLSGVEADFIYDGGERADTLDNCFIFALPIPLAWAPDKSFFSGKEQVVAFLQQAAEPLLKDDIDWSSRLGQLVSVSWG